MTVLALETSTSRGSIALLQDGAMLFDEVFVADRGHGSALFPILERVKRCGPAPTMLAVGLGPGSYAGVRIAIATALGLGLALGAELVGIPSVAALESAPDEYIAIGDARRESFYFTRVQGGVCLEGPLLLGGVALTGALERHAAVPVFTPAALADFPRARVARPRASALAHLAATKPESIVQRGDLEPLYLRDPHITTPKRP